MHSSHLPRQETRILTSDTMVTKSSKPTVLTNLHRTTSLRITTAVASVVVIMVGVRASQRRFGLWCDGSDTAMFVDISVQAIRNIGEVSRVN